MSVEVSCVGSVEMWECAEGFSRGRSRSINQDDRVYPLVVDLVK